MPDGCTARFLTSFTPVWQILLGQVAYGGMPYQWNVIPADLLEPEEPIFTPFGSTGAAAFSGGMNAIRIGGGYVGWGAGRMGTRVQMTYINGWPHSGLTEESAPETTTLDVDDVTGWPGASGMIYDGAFTEPATVLSVSPTTSPAPAYPSGPGTVTLSAPTASPHGAGALLSAIPSGVRWACMLAAKSEGLSRGATATTVQSQPGSRSSASGSEATGPVIKEMQRLLKPFRRVY